MGVAVSKFDVLLVNLDPTQGSEIRKTRPCLVIAPDEMNRHISTTIVAPMTSKGNHYPTRVNCTFQGVQGQIVLDQIRTIDKGIIIKVLGKISNQAQAEVFDTLSQLFSP